MCANQMWSLDFNIITALTLPPGIADNLRCVVVMSIRHDMDKQHGNGRNFVLWSALSLAMWDLPLAPQPGSCVGSNWPMAGDGFFLSPGSPNSNKTVSRGPLHCTVPKVLAWILQRIHDDRIALTRP